MRSAAVRARTQRRCRSAIILTMEHELQSVVFEDAIRAESNLARIEERLPRELHGPLAALLAGSPDPDGALNFMERYTSKASERDLSGLRSNPTALTYLVAIFGYSSFLADTFLAEPGLAVQFARDRAFARLKSKDDLAQDYARFFTASPDLWIASQLARFKRRSELRIALKDVLGISTLAETTRELSELADVLLANALAYCDQELRKRYGEPQYRDQDGRVARAVFSVVSLGKLGGNELNYSSDIDLLYLYSHNGETSGGSEPDSVITNKEYFVRLANAVTRAITQSTPHGAVYRVDLRLRPEGELGDMAISVKSALEYYERRARDWELQMLIKARHSAGDERLTRNFLRQVEARIYGPAVDLAAVETILLSRGRISRKLRSGHSGAVDVKLHAGGIRSIEFLTQCLQRLYGGRDPWVRSGGTLLALRKLNDKGHLSDREYAELTGAYEFLRKVEHRLQLDLGQQTHRLPPGAAAMDRLARRVGIDPLRPADASDAQGGHARPQPGDRLAGLLDETFHRVDEIYRAVIHPRTAQSLREDYALEPPPALLAEHSATYESALRFLAAHAPELAVCVDRAAVPERARKSAGRFLGGLLSSSPRFELARNHPAELMRALEMIGASNYLAAQLIHHPEDFTALKAPLPAPGAAQIEMDLVGKPATAGTGVGQSFPGILHSAGGLSAQMTLLRESYRAHALALAGRDLEGGAPVFESLRGWSRLAANAVATSLEIATGGTPGDRASELPPHPFAILALGRLGMGEFDLASDADLMFAVAAGATPGDIERLTRVAEKIIDVLASYTGDGTVFAVDTRLRPLGAEGELLVTEEALLRYASTRAQVWEAMAYLKSLPIAGDAAFGSRLSAALRCELVVRFGDDPALKGQLSQMRRRLERELTSTPSDLKTSPGAYYDVDYTIACLELQHRRPAAPGSNTLDRVRSLESAGLLNREDAASLVSGASFLRGLDHAIRLVTGRPSRGIPEHTGDAAMVDDLARRWRLVGEDGDSLTVRLREVQESVRSVYRRIVASE